MADYEKVTKGLECCIKHNCADCPFDELGFLGGDMACVRLLLTDTLAVLKKQPKIIRCKDCENRGDEACCPFMLMVLMTVRIIGFVQMGVNHND